MAGSGGLLTVFIPDELPIKYAALAVQRQETHAGVAALGLIVVAQELHIEIEETWRHLKKTLKVMPDGRK